MYAHNLFKRDNMLLKTNKKPTPITPGLVMFMAMASFSSEVSRGERAGPLVNSSAVIIRNMILARASVTDVARDSTETPTITCEAMIKNVLTHNLYYVMGT